MSARGPSSPSRRTALRLGAGATALVGTAALAGDDGTWHAHLPLISQTVALAAPGEQTLVRPDVDAVIPGTRIIDGADDLEQLLADEAAVRSAAGAALSVRSAAAGPTSVDAASTDSASASASTPADAVPAGALTASEGTADLLTSAALDLHVLSVGLAAPVASWAPNWRYVWPRDSAHVAVALARFGLVGRASGIVRELARLCGAGEDAGWFEARYRPWSHRAPDARERQLDGSGWFLWALDEVAALDPTLLDDADVLDAASRTARLLVEITRGGAALPPASPDYWERPETSPTIATCALVAAGLERAVGVVAEAALADAAASAANALRDRIAEAFAATGYGRYPGRVGADAGMLFLLPPYARSVDDDVARHVEAARTATARPAGGVAPGALWRRDGVSWTPQTAMFAQTRAALGDAEGAAALLRWLRAHRTAAGSLPEKVLADGAPASVAPLAWTAALVVGAVLGAG